MGDRKIFTVGDPCFAKVKGWIPYPGRVLSRVKTVKKTKFSILFYGTNEINEVGVENVWHVNPQTVKKMVTEKTLLRKLFSPAWEEMKKQHSAALNIQEDMNDERDKAAEIIDEGSNEREEVTVPGDSVTDEFDDEFSLDFNYLTSKKPVLGNKVIVAKEKEVPVDKVVVPLENESLDLASSIEGEMDTSEGEDVAEEPTKDEEKSWDCLDCGAVIVGEKAFIDHVIDHALEEKAASIEGSKGAKSKRKRKGNNASNAKPEDSASPETANNKPTRPKVKSKTRALPKKPARAKKSKTLRESELETNDAFVEKIVTKEDGTFHCKNCPMFVTSVRLLARSHAQSCSIKKKMGRRSKKSHCDECGEGFEGKMCLVKHIKERHIMPSYQCSICLRKFKSRVTYRRHLKVHSLKTVICPHCPKRFSFESYKNRHVARAHVKEIKTAKSKVSMLGGDEEVVIEITQKEEKNGENFFWEFEASFPNTEKSNSSSYRLFNNSLGLYSKEDWDDWVLASKMLNMSIRADGSNDGFEIALLQEPTGEDKVICVGSKLFFWNKIWTAEDFVEEIISEVVDTAVAVTSLENGQDVGEEEVADSEGDGSIEKALADQNLLLPSSAPRRDEEGGEVWNENCDEKSDGGEEAFVEDSGEASKPGNPPLIHCNQCEASGFKTRWFLRRHISQMHAGGVHCDICGIVFIDKYHYLQHSKTCYFWCSKVGCYFHEKRKSRIESHERKHDRET